MSNHSNRSLSHREPLRVMVATAVAMLAETARAALGRIFVRRHLGDEYLLNTIFSAVVTVLVIRVFLELTHYPQIGGNGLHIAHLLWGGLFMFVGSLLFFLYNSRPVKNFTSYLTGIGWGFFIDEIGKFITSDNNYFFRPAAALIYLLFIFGFLLYYLAHRERKHMTNDERLCDVLEGCKEILEGDLDGPEQSRMMTRLDEVITSEEDEETRSFAQDLSVVIENRRITGDTHDDSTFIVRAAGRLERYLRGLVFRTWFYPILMVGVIGKTLWNVSLFSDLLLAQVTRSSPTLSLYALIHSTSRLQAEYSVVFVMVILFSRAAISMLIVVSLLRYRRGHRETLWLATLSLVFSILLVNVLEFYVSQFSAVWQSITDILLFLIIREYRGSPAPQRGVAEQAV